MALPINKIIEGDCRKIMLNWPENCVDMVMFSPPYWGLRDYGEETETEWEDSWEGQLGLEANYQMYINHMVEVGRAVRHVLKPTGSWWLNLGDMFAGSSSTGRQNGVTDKYSEDYLRKYPQSKADIPAKCKMLMPHRVALALIDDGWICRNDIIWHKTNPMPESVKDRLSKSFEYIFHFVKSKKYYYDLDAIRIPHKKGVTRWGGPTMRKPKDEKKKQGLAKTLTSEDRPWRNPKGKNPGDVIKERGGKYKGRSEHSPGSRSWYWSEQRPNLPKPRKLVKYLRENKDKLSCSEIDKELGYDGDRASHWFTYPSSKHGFSYPSKEDWWRLKKLLSLDDTFDRQMTKTQLVPVTDIGLPEGKNPGDVIKTRGFKTKGGAPHREAFGEEQHHGKDINYHPEGKNPSDFLELPTKPFPDAHFAVYPPELCRLPIKSSCPRDGIVLDPMCGSGSTLIMAQRLGRRWIGIDVSEEYCEMARNRISRECSRRLEEFMR